MKHFNGSDYTPEQDFERLTKQHFIIKTVMSDACWRTLKEIAQLTNYPEASISAQLRHLRKERFGNYIIEKRSRGERSKGLFEYRMAGSNVDSANTATETIKHTCKNCMGIGYTIETKLRRKSATKKI